jgi:hypothetical protein
MIGRFAASDAWAKTAARANAMCSAKAVRRVRGAVWGAVALPLVLSGCAFFSNGGIERYPDQVPGVTLWANLEVASLAMTKKTLEDHIATWVTGDNCSTPRAENDGDYCVPWPRRPAPPPGEYCYATLATATCYARPVNDGNDRLIGFVAPAAIAR